MHKWWRDRPVLKTAGRKERERKRENAWMQKAESDGWKEWKKEWRMELGNWRVKKANEWLSERNCFRFLCEREMTEKEQVEEEGVERKNELCGEEGWSVWRGRRRMKCVERKNEIRGGGRMKCVERKNETCGEEEGEWNVWRGRIKCEEQGRMPTLSSKDGIVVETLYGIWIVICHLNLYETWTGKLTSRFEIDQVGVSPKWPVCSCRELR